MANYSLPPAALPSGLESAPAVAPNPLAAIGPGIQAGAQMGFQARQVAALEQERQIQLAAAQLQAKNAYQKQLTDYMQVAHETYSDLAKINPDHAFDFYQSSIAPVHQEFLKEHGIDSDFSTVNAQHETPEVIKQINSYMDMASQDPSKIPLAVNGLQKISNATNAGEFIKQRVAGSLKAIETGQDYNKNQENLEKSLTEQINVTKARSGGYGTQDQKVNQAIHLRQLANQYLDKSGNYNIPKAQYTEMVLGLANLLSPTGSADEQTRQNLQSMTAKGNLAGAVQFVTGQPQTGNTQSIINNLIDSVDRQGKTAQQLRDTYLMQIPAPKDLEPDRVQKVFGQGRGSNYEDYLPNQKSASQQMLTPEDRKAISWAKSHPKDKRSQQILSLHGL